VPAFNIEQCSYLLFLSDIFYVFKQIEERI